MTEPKMLTAKDLADKAGITPAELRKLLRKDFDRVGKVKVEGNRMEYRFAPNDPVVKQIIQKVKDQAVEKAKEQEAQTKQEKVEPEKAEKPEITDKEPIKGVQQ